MCNIKGSFVLLFCDEDKEECSCIRVRTQWKASPKK